MKNINLKITLWIILIIALLVFILNYLYVEKLNICSYIFNSLTESISVITIIAFLFDRYFWQCSIFRNWLVLIPNLNGKWKGIICSDWINPDTKEKCMPIETSLSIKQSLTNISCVMTTGEMKSNSITSDFRIDINNQVLELSYVYLSIPNLTVRNRSQIHHGAIIFDIIIENNNVIRLKGNYWTDRKTIGTIELNKI